MAKKNLLLVDSDAKALRMLEVSLRKAGFSVTTAISSADAVGKIRVAAPDLILTETKLPDESGLSFVGRLKANTETAHIPVVFLSSENLIDQKVKGLELGVEDYLTKPIYLKEVLTRIRILLEKLERETLERRERSATFAGLLGEMGLVDLVQTIEMGRKTGRIFLDNPPLKGTVAFREGKVVDARTGRLKGERAFYRMLVWNDGVFQMEFGAHDEQDVIELSTQGLLMEGMRRVDEWGRLLEQLPPLEHAFEIDYGELVNRLSEIPDEVNGVLRLFDGKRSLLDVVDESDFGDLEALEIVSRLYFEGLIYDVGDRTPEPLVTPSSEPAVGVERIERWLDTGSPMPTEARPTTSERVAESQTPRSSTFSLAPPAGETTPPVDSGARTGPPSYLTDSMPPVAYEGWDDVVASDEVISKSGVSAVPHASTPFVEALSSSDALADELGLSPDEVALAVAEEERSEGASLLFTPLESSTDENLERALDASLPSNDTDVESAGAAIPASALGRVKGTRESEIEGSTEHASSAVSTTADTRVSEVDTMPERPARRSDISLDEPLPPPSASLPALVESAPQSKTASSSTNDSEAARPLPTRSELDETDRAFHARAAKVEFDSIPPLDDDFDGSRRSPFGTAALLILLLGLGFLGTVGVTRALRGESPTTTGQTAVVEPPANDPLVTPPVADAGVGAATDTAIRDAGIKTETKALVDDGSPTVTPSTTNDPKPTDPKRTDTKPVDTKKSDAKPSTESKKTDAKPADDARSASGDSGAASSTSSDDAFASHLKKATGFAQKGEHSRSIRSFKAALALKGDSAAAHLGLGNAYYELNSIEAALVHLERARALAPDDAQVYVLLGAVYQSAGRTKDATRAYQRYLTLAPNGRFARELKNVLQGLEAQP